MKVAIVGASGKTGAALVRAGLDRGYHVVAVCRPSSAGKLGALAAHERCAVVTAPVISDEATLTRALSGCDAVVALLIAVRQLKATTLVRSLAKAASATGVTRLVFTAGEVTAVREPGERYTARQRIMRAVFPVISRFTPYSMSDMVKASVLVRGRREWEWTIVRAPTLRDAPAAGYRWCAIDEVTAAHALSRDDYAAALLDSIPDAAHHRRTLTVVSAGSG